MIQFHLTPANPQKDFCPSTYNRAEQSNHV